MVRLDKLTDYGLVLLTCIAQSGDNSLRTARDLAYLGYLCQRSVNYCRTCSKGDC